MPLRPKDTKIRKALKSNYNFFAKPRVFEPLRQKKDLTEQTQNYILIISSFTFREAAVGLLS